MTTLPAAAVYLDAKPLCAHIQGKHVRSATLPLRTDLAEDLRKHLAQGNGSELLFDVPVNFTNVYDADLEAAGIPKVDAHGHTLDIHPDTSGPHLRHPPGPQRRLARRRSEVPARRDDHCIGRNNARSDSTD